MAHNKKTMTNNTKYIITSLSSSLGQYDVPGGISGSNVGVVPYMLGGPLSAINLRGRADEDASQHVAVLTDKPGHRQRAYAVTASLTFPTY